MKNALYILGLLIVWAGNSMQIHHTITTKSAEDITLFWPFAFLLSFMLRIVLAWSSDYWVWKLGYVVSIMMVIVLIVVVWWYR